SRVACMSYFVSLRVSLRCFSPGRVRGARVLLQRRCRGCTRPSGHEPIYGQAAPQLRRSGRAGALVARAAQDDVVAERVARLPGDLVQRAFELLVVERVDPAAGVADEMMVVRAVRM